MIWGKVSRGLERAWSSQNPCPGAFYRVSTNQLNDFLSRVLLFTNGKEIKYPSTNEAQGWQRELFPGLSPRIPFMLSDLLSEDCRKRMFSISLEKNIQP